MVLAGSGVYRDIGHINNPKNVFLCDLDSNEYELSNFALLCFNFCHYKNRQGLNRLEGHRWEDIEGLVYPLFRVFKSFRE